MQLLSQKQFKMEKSNKFNSDWLSKIMHLSPHKRSGVNFCSSASPGCIEACLNTSGYGRYENVQDARLNRSKLFIEDREQFKVKLYNELTTFSGSCLRKRVNPAFRPNGTTDIFWEKIFPDMFETFDNVQFYDYTKVKSRMIKFINGDFPSNYHLTFSRSEINHNDCLDILKIGGNVAIVFDKLPLTYLGYPVNSGDEHDLRFLDEFGIVGLTPKAKAKKDKSGFMVNSYWSNRFNRLIGRKVSTCKA